jgi:hypothetical protein
VLDQRQDSKATVQDRGHYLADGVVPLELACVRQTRVAVGIGEAGIADMRLELLEVGVLDS